MRLKNRGKCHKNILASRKRLGGEGINNFTSLSKNRKENRDGYLRDYVQRYRFWID